MRVQSIRHAPHLAEITLPMVLEAVPAGFPSPAKDYFANDIDLNDHLVPHKSSSYLARVTGDSMIRAGIFDGDEVICDRSITPQDGHVVIAVINGELTVKRLRLTPSGVILSAENPKYPDLRVDGFSELTIWGVVTRCLHYVHRT